MDTPARRKQPAHWLEAPGSSSPLVFVTCCTSGRRRWLDRAEVHVALRKAWQAADRWVVGRYVVMPDHIHLFCAPTANAGSLGRWMGYWRGLTTRALGETGGQLWQRDYWDRQLRRADSYAQKWEYVRNNPVRAQLAQRAEDWPFQGELNRLEWYDER